MVSRDITVDGTTTDAFKKIEYTKKKFARRNPLGISLG
jgi:hypothetical protein